MGSTYTSRVAIEKPAHDDYPGTWETVWNTAVDLIDGMAAIGSLGVRLTEFPSASLNIAVAAGSFVKSDGTTVSYAGTGSFAVSASGTTRLWLTDSGVLASGSSFPADTTFIVRLAAVVAGGSTITSITDARTPWRSAGSPLTSGANQVAVGSLATQALTDSTGGTPSTTLAAISDTATKNAVASLAAQLAHVLTDLTALKTLANAERLALVASGTMKGSS